jgi:hypothetical protein
MTTGVCAFLAITFGTWILFGLALLADWWCGRALIRGGQGAPRPSPLPRPLSAGQLQASPEATALALRYPGESLVKQALARRFREPGVIGR